MKHWKLYENYDNHNLLPEIQDFCNDYLAYLLDDKFKVKVGDFNNEIIITITSEGNYETYGHTTIGGFWYEDIVDTFIAFLSMLSEKYNVYEPMIRFSNKMRYARSSGRLMDYSLNELLENNNENLYDMFISNIEIWIGV